MLLRGARRHQRELGHPDRAAKRDELEHQQPGPGTAFNALYAVTALGDGTVVAVGNQEDSTTGVISPLIVQN